MFRTIIRHSGLNLRRLLAAVPDWLRYRRDRRAFRAMAGADALAWDRDLAILGEWRDAAGAPGAYFFQDRLVAAWIHDAAPVRHIDIGSRIDGFIGHLTVFRDVDVLDLRPQPVDIPRTTFHQVDLTRPLDDEWIASPDSLSCLHSIEHFGLGRYGDAIDSLGHLKGVDQLKLMVKPGGLLYVSTPVGRERIEFNAHRIFAPSTMRSWFNTDWTVERSAWIDEHLKYHTSKGDHALRNATGDTGVGILCLRKSR